MTVEEDDVVKVTARMFGAPSEEVFCRDTSFTSEDYLRFCKTLLNAHKGLERHRALVSVSGITKPFYRQGETREGRHGWTRSRWEVEVDRTLTVKFTYGLVYDLTGSKRKWRSGNDSRRGLG